MISCILTDIEGTTSSIDFVHKVLFPYSRMRMSAYLLTHAKDPEIAEIIRRVWTDDLMQSADSAPDLSEVSAALIEWIDKDVKHSGLKALQGKIWKSGFERDDFKGHVYPEVSGCLQRWKKAGLRLAVYSSGSVEAQKLLFGYSEAGNLSLLFTAFFDTAVGAKRERQSYETIAAELKIPAAGILFLSDVPAELDAAEAAGYATCQLIRSSGMETGHHKTAKDFNEVERLFLKP